MTRTCIRRLLLLAALLAVPAAVLLPAASEASTQPPGTSTIGTPGGMCLTAQDGHRTAGTPVVLAACRLRPAQFWVVSSAGTWQLYGTSEYVTVPDATVLTLVLGPAGAAVQTVYVNHRVAADGDWLTRSPGDRRPFLQNAIGPGQSWYIFTAAP